MTGGPTATPRDRSRGVGKLGRTVSRAKGQVATILLVEDDLACAGMLKDLLEDKGYSIWHAPSGTEAQRLVRDASPDLIVLDLMLPDANGLLLCAELKARVDVPIIICSGTQRKVELVLGLKLGADDFVAKPVWPDELLARVEANLRRAAARSQAEPSPTEPIELQIGNLVIEQARCRVMLDGQVVHLTPTEYRLLCALVNRPDEVLTREELAQRVWGYHDPDVARSLDVHMRRLRGKLQACAGLPPTIVTVRGFGYKIVSVPDESLPQWHAQGLASRVGLRRN